jgi:hypothetical protein
MFFSSMEGSVLLFAQPMQTGILRYPIGKQNPQKISRLGQNTLPIHPPTKRALENLHARSCAYDMERAGNTAV